MRKCRNCNTYLKKESCYCPNCGVKITTYEKSAIEENNIADVKKYSIIAVLMCSVAFTAKLITRR